MLEKELLLSIKDTQQDFELFYDLDLEVLSKNNIQRLQEHIKKGIEGQPPLTEERLPSGLTVQEARFMQYILENSQFTHNTASLANIKDNDNTMKSLQERAAAREQTQNRNTKAGSKTDGYLYFTFGQTIPRFLSAKPQDKITFNPNILQNLNKATYQHAFISWYPCAGLQRRTTPIYYLDNCRFHYTHVSDTKKLYIYHHEDQKPIHFVATASQEIFYGEDILRGLAYQMILHLRLIGGSYRQHILNHFDDNNVLTAFQEMIYPVDYYPEFKLPVQFNIENSGVMVTEAKFIDTEHPSFIDEFRMIHLKERMAGSFSFSYLDEKDKLYENPSNAKTDYQKKILLIACVQNGNLNQAESLISHNKFDLNEEYPIDTLLNTAIKDIENPEQRMSMVKLLIQYGADPSRNKDSGNNSFYYAVKKKDKTLFGYLLTIKHPHPLDVHIQKGPFLHQDKQLSSDKNILDLICENNLMDRLPLAIQYGANIHHFPCLLYAIAAKAGHVDVVAALIHHGVSLEDVLVNAKTPLMIFAEQGNEEGVKLLLQHEVDIHHRCYFDKKYVNALDLALKSKKPNENIIRLLREKGLIETATPPSKNQKRAVAIIVTAEEQDGDRYVLLGQKKNKDNTIDDEYCFPGGLVEIRDQDFIETAMRELEEETNIKLRGSQLKGKFSQHTAFTFSEVYQDTYFHIQFIHFHLFVNPHTIRIKPDDDMGAVSWLPLSSVYVGYDKFEMKRFLIKERETYTLIKQSNGLVLDSLFRTSLDIKAMKKALRIDNFGEYLLIDATKCDDVAEIKDLLHHRANYLFSLEDIGTPLNLAAASGSMNAVKFYLKFDPDLLHSSTHPAVSAATNNAWDIFALLYDDHLDDHSKGMILMHCIIDESLSRVLFCLQHFKININQRLEGEQYFITLAAKTGNIRLVKLLIHFGANVNPALIGLDENVTKVLSPLHAAINIKKEEMAIFLIQQGADINCRDNITQEQILGTSYRHFFQNFWSAQQGQKPNVSSLVKNPLDLMDRNYNHNAVMKALINDCQKVMDFILNNDLFIDIKLLDGNALPDYHPRYPKLVALFDENHHHFRNRMKLLN